MLVHARKIQREFRLAEDETTIVSSSLEPIRLGILESVAIQLLEAVVANYQAGDCKSPLSVQEGKEAEIAGALSKNKMDVAITILDKSNVDPSNISLFTEPYMLMVSDQHKIAGRPIVSPEEISQETMIARRSCEILPQTSKFFTAHGARPPFSYRSPHEDRVMAMVRAGLGITVAPLSHRIAGVSAIQLEGFPHIREIGLVYGNNGLGKFGSEHILTKIICDTMETGGFSTAGVARDLIDIPTGKN